MVAESVTNALKDGKLSYQAVQQAVVGFVDGKIVFSTTLKLELA